MCELGMLVAHQNVSYYLALIFFVLSHFPCHIGEVYEHLFLPVTAHFLHAGSVFFSFPVIP
jgi:hypothetical protein